MCSSGSRIQLLLPITLANSGTLQWSSYKIITMLVIGPVLLIVLTFYEARFAHYPFIPARFLKNRTVLAAALIGLFDFISFHLQFTYQYSFICKLLLMVYPSPYLTNKRYISCRQGLDARRPELLRTNTDNLPHILCHHRWCHCALHKTLQVALALWSPCPLVGCWSHDSQQGCSRICRLRDLGRSDVDSVLTCALWLADG